MAWYKKLFKYVAPIAGIASSFIPGVGPAIGGAISGVLGKVGGMFGGGSAQSQAPPQGVQPDGTHPPVTVESSKGFDWGSMVQPAAALGSGLLNYYGQKQTNAASAQQAQRQMDFQASQTGTSYQRGVADMKAAGLNPMLAYSQGGAASGGGAQGQVGNELGSGANSAWQAASAVQQLRQGAAQTENIQADTENKQQQTTNLESENLYTLARTTSEGTRNHELTQRVAQIALENQLRAATQNYSISSARSGADVRGYEAAGLKAGLPEKQAWENFYRSTVGKSYPYVSKATEQSNSAANVFRKFIPFTND